VEEKKDKGLKTRRYSVMIFVAKQKHHKQEERRAYGKHNQNGAECQEDCGRRDGTQVLQWIATKVNT
jgi:hypothetical protein